MATNTRVRQTARIVREKAVRLFTIIITVGICYIIIMPLLTKISSSFMMEIDLYDNAVKWIPRNPTLANYRIAWRGMEYPLSFLNSFSLSLLVSILQLVSCTLVGYGFARFDFPAKNLFFGLVVLTLVVPPQVIMTPLYLNFRHFNFFGLLPTTINLLNTPYPIIGISVTANGLKNGLFIYIMRQFFAGMPKELEEAAYVDGASLLQTFSKIMIPGSVPAMVIVFLFSFVWQWNDYFYTSLFMGRVTLLSTQVETVAINYVAGMQAQGQAISPDVTMTGQYMSLIENTAMLLFIIPLLMIYIVLQRYFIESIERTGIIG